MLARVPWAPAFQIKVKPARPRRLGRERQRVISDRIVAIMRAVEPTPFAAEGPCRAGVRSSLCLQGWSWKEAEAAAAEIVLGALNILGAKRPNWYQGQPDWTRPGALPIERETCAECRRPLPEGRRRFCCDEHRDWFHGAREREANAEAIAVRKKAQKVAWTEKQPARSCEWCKDPFQPKEKNQRYCSVHCARCATGLKERPNRAA